MAHQLHLGSVGIKHAVVVCFGVFVENFVQLLRRGVAVSGTSLFGHLDAAIGHKGSFQRFVGLQAHHFFQILGLLVDIARTVGGKSRHHLGLHIKHTAFGTLLLLQLLQLAPQGICSISWSTQETLIAIVGCVVVLDKVSYVDFFFPKIAFEVTPCVVHTVDIVLLI